MSIALKTIALAEDDPVVMALLKASLESLGYEIVGIANNGLEALQVAQLQKPQLILIDIHMPVMNGLEAAKQIIALGTTAVVTLTGDVDPSLARQALDLGVCGYMQKPLQLTQLVPVMETAWHRFQAVKLMKAELSTLNETLETRKLLEKAKGILMEQQGFTEEMAHKVIQKMSQDQAIALKEVCRSIIQVRMVLGKAASKRAA